MKVTIDPGTYRLVGMPTGRILQSELERIELPPCPACGRTIEVEYVGVASLADDPSDPPVVPGPWACPDGCHPGYPRVVVAPSYPHFAAYCRDRGWNPTRVLFASSFDGTAGRAVRGMVLLPDMIDVVGPLSFWVREELMARIKPGMSWDPFDPS